MQISSLHFFTKFAECKRNHFFLTVLLILMLAFISCSKDESNNNLLPAISLKTGGIYVSSDTAIAEGLQITIGIKAFANNGENLTNLLIISNDSIRLFDYGFNAISIDKDVLINKNSDSIQDLAIIIRNSKGLSSTLNIKLIKNGSAYKSVIYFPEITLGAQNNIAFGSFASLANAQVYVLNNAYQNQQLIDLLYYYNTIDFNALGSPGANVTGIYSGSNAPEYWTVKNTTYFSRNIINVPVSSFDNAINDSLIIANTFVNGGRKAKSLASNQIWAFQTQSGKFGLIKVIQVDGQESGSVKIAVKIQQ